MTAEPPQGWGPPATTREDQPQVLHRPPTVREPGRDGSRRPQETVREQGTGTGRRPPQATVREGVESGASFARVNLPPPLAADYERLYDLDGIGGEADLIVCRPLGGGDPVVVKLYRGSGIVVDEAMLEQLRRADPAHLVRLLGWGHYQGLVWEVMEHITQGSLVDLARAEGPALPVNRLDEILAELVPAIEHLHAMRIIHRDIKPSNVLVRSDGPLDLVLGDFGLAVETEASRVMLSGSRTCAYAAPEAAAGDTWPGTDWWALGMTLLELATGEHPFRVNGRWFNERQIMAQLASTTIDVSGAPGERWQLLLRGLLTADREHRWGSAQIAAWRRGESPAVVVPPPVGAAPAIPPFTFLGVPHAQPETLAAAMAGNWHAAADLVIGRDLEQFSEWLDRFTPGPGLQAAVQDCRSRRLDVDRLVAALIVELSPGQQPTFHGYSVRPPELAQLARRAIGQAGAERAAVNALRTSGALAGYRHAPECQSLTVVADLWQRSMDEVQRRLAQPGIPPPVRSVSADLLAARLLLMLLDHQEQRRVASAARKARRVAGHIPWFRSLTGAATQDMQVPCDLLAVIAEPVAADEAGADSRQRADELVRARNGARAARVLGRRRIDSTLLTVAALLAVCVVPPYWIGQRIWLTRLTTPTPTGTFRAAVWSIVDYLPSYLFGVLAVLGVVGALMALLPPYTTQTVGRVVLIVVLVATGLIAPTVADWSRSQMIERGQAAYLLGPVPTGQLGSTCGTVWTGTRPEAGSIYTFALISRGSTGIGGCQLVRAYRGWATTWSSPAGAGTAFQSIAVYDALHLVVVRRDTSGRPNDLLALDRRTGKARWTWTCPVHNIEYLDGEVYHGVKDHSQFSQDSPFVTVRCVNGAYRVDVSDGKGQRT